MLEKVFWACAIASIYSYVLYPAILLILPRRGVRPAGKPALHLTPITLIITCRNEEGRLRQKLDNTLAIDYPSLEIIVASDASEDGSDRIAREYEASGVRLIRSPERLGKEHAQALAVSAASHDIIVFSDAGTDIQVDALRYMLANFCNPRVGAVSSEDVLVAQDGNIAGEGVYVRYEMWLRRLEASVNSLIGLSGSFFAVRRSILDKWDTSIPSDFACALNVTRVGMVAVADSRVRGTYLDLKDTVREYPRKVRTATGGMAAIAALPEVLNPFRYGLFAFQVWSHKIMRWMVPWLLLTLLVSSALLAQTSGFFLAVFCLQAAVYGFVLAAHSLPRLRRLGFVRIPYYFVQVNIALAHGLIHFLRGQKDRYWEPSTR